MEKQVVMKSSLSDMSSTHTQFSLGLSLHFYRSSFSVNEYTKMEALRENISGGKMGGQSVIFQNTLPISLFFKKQGMEDHQIIFKIEKEMFSC